MNKYNSNALLAGKLNFRTTSLLMALLVTTFSLNVFAQKTASPVEAAIREIKQTEPIEKEDVQESSSIDLDAPELITVTTYAFSAQSGVALEDMSTGTTQLVAANLDDTASAVTNIGFDFWYDGVRYTQFSCNANGLCRLGGTAVTTSFNNTTDFATTTNSPKIAPYYDDLYTGTNGKVHFKVVGAAGNRKLVVEFLNEQIPLVGAGSAGAGTFQLWLYDSANTISPGVIQFVYGNGIVANTTNGGYTVGLQSGAATNLASVTTSTNTVSYATANNTQTNAITAGTSYLFTPNIPLAPTGLTFTGTNAIGTTLNFADNATNEVGYAIYRSTDGGATYTFLAQTAANTTTYTDSGLSPTTTYFYQVYAVTEGALSNPPLTGSTTTAAAGNDTCAGAGGNYSAPATWADGTVPTAGDNVTIQNGCTVTVDTTTAAALTLTVQSGGTLQYIATPTSTLTVGTNVTIDLGGTITAGTGALTTHALNVGGDLTNNGTLDLSTTAGVGLTFTGAANNTFGGTGATTDVRAITVNKGTSNANILELTTTNFTVQGVTTDVAGFLTLTNGTFKISGTFTVTNRVFTTAAYVVGATQGIWLNNPNFTIAGQNGSPTPAGLLRLTQGTYNVGTTAGNSLLPTAGAVFIIEGGTLNVAGRFQSTATITYNQSAGTVNVATVGNAAATGSFGLTATTNTFNLTGGSIVLVLPSTNATPLDYSVSTSSTFTANPAGTTLQLGNGSTPAASTFRVTGNTPNILISTGQTMAVGSGTAGAAIFFRGATFTNNGAVVIQGTGASSRFDFAANGAMTYGGTGTFGTATTPFAGVGISANTAPGITTTFNAPVFVNRVNLFSGVFVNSNQITLGNGGTSTTVVQIGSAGLTTAGGSFDVSPVHNQGSGGEIILYAFETAPRTTGVEINPTRILTQLIVDDSGLTLSGGNLTVTAAMTLTNGIVSTGANTLIHNGTATRTNGFVVGNLSRAYAAVGAYTYFVGDNTGTPEYSPMTANVTATTAVAPSSLTVSVTDALLPGLDSAQSASRYWTLTENGDLTADLAFTYVDSDISGDETVYKVYRREAGVTAIYPGGNTNNAATNTATVTGVTDFSDWGIGTALAPTAAAVNVGGRVLTADGRGISGARVYMTDTQGNIVVRQTNPAGYYRFIDVGAGANYILTVEHKSYRFQPAKSFFITDENLDVNFVAEGLKAMTVSPKANQDK